MQQADDFLEESEILAQLIAAQCAGRWDHATQFKGWTVNDVLVHLHFWNMQADLSLTDPENFKALIANSMAALKADGLRPMENAAIPERGAELFAVWQAFYRDMASRWRRVDPKQRVEWVGPSMSARSSITARQMETWAHGHEIFDLFGVSRAENDRIKNIVILGVNTFGFSFKIRGKQVPEHMPQLTLTAPSGETWRFGEEQAGRTAGHIEGSAVAFAQAVTQTRNYRDTDLRVTGELAIEWMENAQCFAGAAETPPASGSRHRQ